MPIATCFIKEGTLSQKKLQEIALVWANEISVGIKDINLSVIPCTIQAGRQYEVMVNLFLPSLWTKVQVETIQLSLVKLFAEHLNIKPDDVFIITSTVQSGHVVENGKPVYW